MIAKRKDLSANSISEIPTGKGKRIAIVVAEWNEEVTNALLGGAVATLLKHGMTKSSIVIHHVPGAFELTLGALLVGKKKSIDAVICLGCVVQGETKHFDFICQGVTYGITELNISLEKPVVFGVLTTETMKQALQRAGGKHGNKGDEAAITALKMIALKNTIIG